MDYLEFMELVCIYTSVDAGSITEQYFHEVIEPQWKECKAEEDKDSFVQNWLRYGGLNASIHEQEYTFKELDKYKLGLLEIAIDKSPEELVSALESNTNDELYFKLCLKYGKLNPHQQSILYKILSDK